MKNRKTMHSGLMWLLLSVFLALGMLFGQTLVWAQVNCGGDYDPAADPDQDGFTNAEECQGNILGLTLNPNKKDLFVIWVPANPTYLPNPHDPFEYVRGLPIDVHPITEREVNADRSLPGSSLKQKAVRVSESLDPNTNDPTLGFSYEGTPMTGRDESTAYTVRIKLHMEECCGCSGPVDSNWCQNCCDSISRVCGQDLLHRYIKHTIAHEIGHMIRPLANVTQRNRENFGGPHYKSGTNVILDQSVKFSQGKFSLGTTYTQPDKDSITLK